MGQRYYSPFVIDHTQVPSTQTDFPVLLLPTDIRFATPANGGHQPNASGFSLRPCTDDTGATEYDFELAPGTYNASAGSFEMWVRIPSLSASVDTTIYLFYGDSSLTTDGSSTGTWPSQYKLVLHLGNGTSLSSNDSSSNINNFGIHSATATTGKIDGAASFSSASLSNGGIAGFSGDFTFSFWMNNGNVANGYVFDAEAGRLVIGNDGGAPTSGALSFYDGTWRSIGSARSNNTTYFHCLTLNAGSSTATGYTNGSSIGTASYSTVSNLGGTTGLAIGSRYSGDTAFYSGWIDEFRISNAISSPDWITTEYNNQSAPNTFAALGTEVAIDLQFDAASNSGYKTASVSYSFNHTNLGDYLVVGVSMLSVAGSSVSGITYNSVAMTFLGAVASVSGAVRTELWGLAAPATGTHAIAVSLSASLDSVSNACSFYNVNQSSSTEALNTASATNVGAADATVNVTTVADNDWVINNVATDDTAITAGSGLTQRSNVTGTLGSGAMSTYGPKTPAGSVTQDWTNVAALATWSIAAIALKQVSVGGAPTYPQLERGIRGLTRGLAQAA